MTEHEGCFEFDIQADTKEDVVKLARFGMNHTKEIRGIYVYLHKSNEVAASIILGKLKDPTNQIQRA